MLCCFVFPCFIVKGRPQWIRPVIGECQECVHYYSGLLGSNTSGQVSLLTHLCIVCDRRTLLLQWSAVLRNTPKVSLTLVQYVTSNHSCTSSWTLNQPCRERLLYFIVVTSQNSIFFLRCLCVFNAPGHKMVACGSRRGWEGSGWRRKQGL